MRSNIIGLACLVLLAVPVRAEQEPTISMKIDVVAWGNEIKGLSFKPGSSKGDITALGFRYSKPVAYSGPVIMEIYQSSDAPASPAGPAGPAGPAMEIPGNGRIMPPDPIAGREGATSANKANAKQGLALELEKRRRKEPALVSLAALPGGGCLRATVLLAPADDGTFTSYVIDDDPTKLPVGRVRIHNLSPFPIAMRCNGQPARELRTREAILVPAIRDHLLYELAYKLGDEWKMQENNVLRVRPKEQTQMIILKSNNSFFLASDGSRSGFLQIITLRRSPETL